MTDYEKLKEIEEKILQIIQTSTHHLVITEMAKALVAVRITNQALDGDFFFKGIGE